jgi:alanine racemase
MDMTLVDVTHIPHASAGDETILFGTSPRIEDVAAAADTIPYELLTRIPARVQRVQRGG